jgi:transcription elongation factor Elf1
MNGGEPIELRVTKEETFTECKLCETPIRIHLNKVINGINQYFDFFYDQKFSPLRCFHIVVYLL